MTILVQIFRKQCIIALHFYFHFFDTSFLTTDGLTA